MARFAKLLQGFTLVAAAFAGGVVGSVLVRPESPAAGMIDVRPESGIVGTFGVGGVVTQAGELWQYRPDKQRWVSLDESFALEGQATSVVPLPVPMATVRFMETFGFLVTEDGTCWLYSPDDRVWRDVGKPPVRTGGR